MTTAIATDPYAWCTTVIDVLRSMAEDAPDATLRPDDVRRAEEYLMSRTDLHRGQELTPQRARTKVRNALHNDHKHFTWHKAEKLWVYSDAFDEASEPALPPPARDGLPLLPKYCGRCGGRMAWQGYYTCGGQTGRVWTCIMCGREGSVAFHGVDRRRL